MQDISICDGECDEYRAYMDEHFNGAVAAERKEAMGLPWDAVLSEDDNEKRRQTKLRRQRGIVWERDEPYINEMTTPNKESSGCPCGAPPCSTSPLVLGDIKYTIPNNGPFTESLTSVEAKVWKIDDIQQDSLKEQLLKSRPDLTDMIWNDETKPLEFEHPSWTDYLLGLAFIASRRSRDPHTKHGCVLADQNGRILGIGYNSPPAGMNDISLPYNRPTSNPPDPEEDSKYDWMVHSEPNALANATFPLMYVPGGVTAYITGKPCSYCSMLLVQNGVTRFVIANRKGWGNASLNTDKAARNFVKLTTERNISVEYVSPQLDWMLGGVEELYKLGFFKKLSSFIVQLIRKPIYDIIRLTSFRDKNG
jgi:dCMP deaminase